MRPEHTRAIVVLPAPFEPEQREHPAAAASENETPKIARNGPYAASTSRSSSSGRPAAALRRRRPSDDVPEVGLAHRVVGEHLVGRARRDQRAEVEHEHPLHEAAHELDVVLDEQDRDALLAAAPRAAVRASASVSWRSSPDDGSSSSTQLRLRSSAPARSRPAGRRRGSATRPGGRRPRPRPSSSSIALGARRFSSAVGPPEEQHVLPERAAPVAHPLGDEEVLARRHAREQLDALERARRCRAGPGGASATRVRSRPSNVHASAVGLQDAEQAVEERRLARAVRTDQPDDLVLARRRGSTSSSAVMPANVFVTPSATSRLTCRRLPARRSARATIRRVGIRVVRVLARS